MPANDWTVDIKDFAKLQATLDRKLGNLVKDNAARALRAEAEIEMTEAKRRCPVDTGVLRATGHVQGPVPLGDGNWEVKLVFGGPAAPYAADVHENLDAYHDDGEAKYLESVIAESKPYFAERVMKRMQQG